MQGYVIDVWEDDRVGRMKTFEPVFCGLDGVSSIPETLGTRLSQKSPVFGDENMHRIAIEREKNLVITRIVG